ncbi:hypothetical protein F3087_15270 [Nocardia colli]|uniref:Uncharacterized protein n=1 Tax=Nocardia colli TaxID=2545717 RepID=A0A5N0EHB3_9NOCA|nr:hypothetical protein [Nocardia colli]KAA8888386.1 hypothetical protein F3087_15270 [Nocardia colli]
MNWPTAHRSAGEFVRGEPQPARQGRSATQDQQEQRFLQCVEYAADGDHEVDGAHHHDLFPGARQSLDASIQDLAPGIRKGNASSAAKSVRYIPTHSMIGAG